MADARKEKLAFQEDEWDTMWKMLPRKGLRCHSNKPQSLQMKLAQRKKRTRMLSRLQRSGYDNWKELIAYY